MDFLELFRRERAGIDASYFSAKVLEPGGIESGGSGEWENFDSHGLGRDMEMSRTQERRQEERGWSVRCGSRVRGRAEEPTPPD